MSEIENLKAEIDDLEQEVLNLKEEIREKDSEIADLEDDVYWLRQKADDAECDMDDLENWKKTASDLKYVEEEHSAFVEALGKILGVHRTSRFHVDPLNCVLVEVKDLIDAWGISR